jgi:hypothetical protein
MKKLIIAAFLPIILLFNVNGQELLEDSKYLCEYEVMDEGGYGYYSSYTPVSSSSTFIGALSTSVINFNSGATPPSNLSTLEAEIKRIEMLQNSLQAGTYSTTELQSLLNKQNLSFSMLQSILKMWHDQMKNIIRNLGG